VRCQSRRLLASLACLLVVAVGCDGRLLDTLAGGRGQSPRGRIAYVGGQGDIFTVRPDGSERRQLTHLGGPEGVARSTHAWPTWSPDGRLIAATRVDAEDGSVGGLYTLPAGGGEPTRVFAAEGALPFFGAWSPDARAIAILAREADGVALHVRRADGAEGRRLLVGDPLYLAWRPDGRALIAHVDGDAGDDPAARVLLLPVDGAPTSRLPAAPNAFRAPAVTRDGRTTLVGAPGPDGRGGVVALAAADGSARTLLDGGWAPAFVLSPRGDRVAVGRQVEGAPGVLDGVEVVDLDTGAVARWYSGPVVAFFWSPDGARLAWAAVDWSNVELQWQVAEGPGRGRRIAAFRPSVPFGSTLAFFDQYAPTTGLWSPDSRALVFAGWVGGLVDGPSRVWVADAGAAGDPRAVADGVMASWSPR
jgi:dipeptidyl aminopeptidase/acylaminoacyl peptidase